MSMGLTGNYVFFMYDGGKRPVCSFRSSKLQRYFDILFRYPFLKRPSKFWTCHYQDKSFSKRIFDKSLVFGEACMTTQVCANICVFRKIVFART